MPADMHIHSVLGNPGTEWFLHYEKLAQRFKELGVTMIRDGGDTEGLCTRYRSSFEDRGIRYLSPVSGICREGRYGRCFGRGVRTERETVDMIRELKREGADFIKVFVTGFMKTGSYGCTCTDPPCFSNQELRTIVEEAGEAGMVVMAHVNTPEEILSAVDAGVLSVEHGYGTTDECIAAMAENGTFWVPTVTPIAALSGESDPMKRYLREQLDAVRRGAAAGVRIVPGSDSAARMVPHAVSTLREYEFLGQCGLIAEQLDANAALLFERTLSMVK